MILAVSALIIATISLIVGLVCLREIGEIYIRTGGIRSRNDDGVPVGAKAPLLTYRLANGERTTIRSWADSNSGGLVIFGSTQCGLCERLRQEVSGSGVTFPILFIYENLPDGASDMPTVVQAIGSSRAARWGVMATPFAFVLDADATVRSKGVVNTVSDLEELFRMGAESPNSEAGARDA